MNSKPRLVFSKPENKSLEAYKAWIKGTSKALGIKGEELSEQEWLTAWKGFWSK